MKTKTMKTKTMKKLWLLCSLISLQVVFGQTITDYEQEINNYALNHSELYEKVKVELSDASLVDYIRAIATEHQINVYVAPNLKDHVVTTHFYDIPVRQVFIFLTKEFDLEVAINNEVISFRKKPEVVEAPKVKPVKAIDISYSKTKDWLSVNLKNDSLPRVAEAITKESGKNIVLAPDIKETKVSAFMLNSPFDQVLDMMSKSNGLVMTKNENGFYFLEKDVRPKEQKNRGKTAQSSSNKNKKSGAVIELLSNGFLKINAKEAMAEPLISEMAAKVNANYIFYDIPDKNVVTTIYANQISFDEALKYIFSGSDFTFKKDDSFYFIGKRQEEDLRVRELIQFENRSMEDIIKSIPKDFEEKVKLQELKGLNGVMAFGSQPNIDELKDYIYKIDQVVPLILIDVMIVQYQKSHEVQTGLQAILDKTTTQQTGGVLFPDPNVTLNSNSINNLIDAFNGYGLFKIGKVTKDFYLTLSALENNSVITTKSTPNIATLSGEEATFSVGQKTYYFEQNNQIVNQGVNNAITQSGSWKPIQADLSLAIEPVVSKDEHVTLKVKVTNDRFLGRAGEGAPPGTATQNFESEIRVRNGEMVLLGGLEELNDENSGTGTPLLSRIPIIKWFFSGRSKIKSKSKMHIFIKPTVVY